MTRIPHPPNNAPAYERVCPITGKLFAQCWTNNLATPWVEGGECDQCAESPGHTLARLNAAAEEEIDP